MKVVITGGAGLIGSHIADLLVKKGVDNIIIIDDFSRGKYDNLSWSKENGNVKIIKGSVLDSKLLLDIFDKTDFVFHQAAIRITQCATENRLAHDVMATGTFNVAEAAVKSGVKKIIAASSASIYGQAKSFPTNENHNPYSDDTLYGATKSYLEKIFRSFKSMYDLDYVALRYFNVYGPRMDTSGKYTEVIIRWLECIKNNRQPIIFGDGSISMDLIHVKDVARANILAMEKDITDEVFNIGTQKETTLKELLSMILKMNNSSLSPIYKPLREVNSVQKRIADINKAKMILKFDPMIDIESGLKDLLNWYNSNTS